jgi:hypothetical protein
MGRDRTHRPDTPIQVWACLNPAHQEVTWTGDVARCDTCGLTSEMTGEFAAAASVATALAAVLARLEIVAADLDLHIEACAVGLAAPHVAEAAAEARAAKDALDGAWAAADQRLADVQREHRRRDEARDRIVENARSRLAATLGQPSGERSLGALVTAALVERNEFRAALARHMQSCESKGTRLCGGCLNPHPCPDATLLGLEATDGH